MGHLKEKTATLNWHLCFGRKVIILSLPSFKVFFETCFDCSLQLFNISLTREDIQVGYWSSRRLLSIVCSPRAQRPVSPTCVTLLCGLLIWKFGPIIMSYTKLINLRRPVCRHTVRPSYGAGPLLASPKPLDLVGFQ